MINKADLDMERALDIRTILRMQSVLLTVTRVLFKRDHRALLKLQRFGRQIDLETEVSEADVLFSPDAVDSEAIEDAMLK